MQTRRVRLPFIGPVVASFSDFGPIRFRQAGVIRQMIRQAESTASGIIGSASVAHMLSLWCTRKNMESYSRCSGLNSLPRKPTRRCRQLSGPDALRPPFARVNARLQLP